MTIDSKKIRKFTYSYICGSWNRMFGGVIWSENEEYLFTYLYNYYNPNPHELMVATEVEKKKVESIFNEIIQNNSTPKADQLSDDDTNTVSNNLDFFCDFESDYMGYGECTVIHDEGKMTLSPIDEISVQALDSSIKGMSSDRKNLIKALNDETDALKVCSIDIREKRKWLYSVVYDNIADVYFVYNQEKPYGDIRIIKKQFIEDMIAVFQQRTDFSNVPTHLEINGECFLFGSGTEQKAIEAIIEEIYNNDNRDILSPTGLVKVAIIKQRVVIEDIVLLLIGKNPNIIKVLLKNGDVFFSKKSDLITVHNPQVRELEMINEEKGFALYKRWNVNWVKYLEQHLAAIRNWKMKSNHDVRGEMVNVYYLANDHLARLGAYSEGILNWFPEDENAVGVLEGMMKYNSLFWE